MQFVRRFTAAVALALVAAFTFVTPAAAQDLSDWSENNLVDFLFRAQTWTVGADLHFGLSTAGCSDSSVGTEVTGGNYARVAVTRSLANFAGTQSAGSTIASSGTGGVTSNNAAISWGTVTWSATVSHFFVATASSGGNIVLCKAITGGSKTVNSGDTVQFGTGAFTLTVQ
jgi:hypothetical protein